MRKNVRKLEALLLAGAMAVTTAGCMPTSKSQDSAGGQSAQESSTAQNTGKPQQLQTLRWIPRHLLL